jgi:Uma2 family endonuclease
MSARQPVMSYLSGAESLRRRELVWGFVREPPAPFWPHQAIVTRTTVLLYEHVASRSLGEVSASPLDVVLDEARGLVVQPDVVFLSNERLRLVRNQVWGAPDLVVEVESPGTRLRDRVHKRGWYRRYGVREYWLIDAGARTVTVFGFSEGRATARTFKGPKRVRSAVLPDFDRPASAFFGPRQGVEHAYLAASE